MKKSSKQALILSITLLAALPVGAQIFGAGNDTCASWLEARKLGFDELPSDQWIFGYLSGILAAGDSDSDTNDPNALISNMLRYCQSNPGHSLARAAGGTAAPAGLRVAGLGEIEGRVSDQSEMNKICRDAFPNRAYGQFPVRWATTRDYDEYSAYKGWNNDMVRIDEEFALRGADTIHTNDGRAYDQATGALGPGGGSSHYHGAVLLKLDRATFTGRGKLAKPLCVFGRPNPDLR